MKCNIISDDFKNPELLVVMNIEPICGEDYCSKCDRCVVCNREWGEPVDIECDEHEVNLSLDWVSNRFLNLEKCDHCGQEIEVLDLDEEV